MSKRGRVWIYIKNDDIFLLPSYCDTKLIENKETGRVILFGVSISGKKNYTIVLAMISNGSSTMKRSVICRARSYWWRLGLYDADSRTHINIVHCPRVLPCSLSSRSIVLFLNHWICIDIGIQETFSIIKATDIVQWEFFWQSHFKVFSLIILPNKHNLTLVLYAGRLWTLGWFRF